MFSVSLLAAACPASRVFLDYAFFIDYADGSSAHSSIECTTHSQQGWKESRWHRGGRPRSSFCDLVNNGVAEPLVKRIESRTASSV